MPPTWKTVRVFISSTFRDMHAERDYLVKVVFPALRERLEKYRIHLIDIDLRWGITEEDAQQDRVLDLCLQQIDECRPFLVGILGERYGWVPSSFSAEAASKYGGVQHQAGKSITELEILYGVLHNPAMHGHAMFYFRDPTFITQLPEAKRCNFLGEDALSRQKLAVLKEAIRRSDLPHPPFEDYPCRYAGLYINRRLAQQQLTPANYTALERIAENGIVDPEEYRGLDSHLRELIDRWGTVQLAGLDVLGRRVQKDLWEAIQADNQLPDMPPNEAGATRDPLAEEAAYHDAFIESRLRVYVGREDVHRSLLQFADGDGTVPCVVTGPSGSGKSAAMARFVRDFTTRRPAALMIPHFVGASPNSTSLRQVLRRFCLAIRQRFDEHFEADKAQRLGEITESEEAVRRRSAVEPDYEVPEDRNGLVRRFRQFIQAVPADASPKTSVG